MSPEPTPTEIKLKAQQKQLVITFDNGAHFELSCEFLRVYSPSAEVKGHGPGQEVLQIGKEDVAIKAIDPVGRYGIKLSFDDGHDTGIYSWQYLHDLGLNKDAYWSRYLAKLQHAGAGRGARII